VDPGLKVMEMIDFYELLQISPNADTETIHRVYRYLAARFHPDNAETGDSAKFQLVKSAYDVLSNPTHRREYDAKRQGMVVQPLSSSIDFMDHLEGEVNRRIAVLAVLYYHRRMSPNSPDVSLADIEKKLGFPRDYLDFTLWYLVRKKYINKADNADYALTAEGVDFVEKERVALPVLNGLLTSNTGTMTEAIEEMEKTASSISQAANDRNQSASPSPSKTGRRSGKDDRRSGSDRRVGAPDLRLVKVERRQSVTDRRVQTRDRRASR
jgi:curved DNA-binding protein